MNAPLLLLATACLAAPAARPAPDSDVARVFSEIEKLERSQRNDTLDAIREKDRRARALAPDVLRWGERAVGPLEAVARDPQKPPKTRLLAVSVMGMSRDPAAYGPLEAILLGTQFSDDLRSEAALGLGGLAVQNATRRASYCAALKQDDLPPQTLAAVLREAAKLGCDEPLALEKRARMLGLRPAGRDAALAAQTLRALGRSFPPDASRALWRLFASYPTGSVQRREALEALLADPERLAALGSDNEANVLRAMREEYSSPENAALAARLAAQVGTPRCAEALRRALRNGDPEVIAEAAEGLARLKTTEAIPELQAIVSGAVSDARFAPKPNRPRPAEQLARIEAALKRLNERSDRT